jgi:hypothetical protein
LVIAADAQLSDAEGAADGARAELGHAKRSKLVLLGVGEGTQPAEVRRMEVDHGSSGFMERGLFFVFCFCLDSCNLVNQFVFELDSFSRVADPA